MQYMTEHPEWTPDPPELLQARMALRRNLDPVSRERLESHIEHLELHVTQPPYTCPSCRAPVKKRPIEAFALKSIVHTIAAAEGEQPPQVLNAAGRLGDHPWDDRVHRLAVEKQYIKKYQNIYNISGLGEIENQEDRDNVTSNVVLYSGKDEDGTSVNLEFASVSKAARYFNLFRSSI